MGWGQGLTAPGRGQAGSLDESSDHGSGSSHGEELPEGGLPSVQWALHGTACQEKKKSGLGGPGAAL